MKLIHGAALFALFIILNMFKGKSFFISTFHFHQQKELG